MFSSIPSDLLKCENSPTYVGLLPLSQQHDPILVSFNLVNQFPDHFVGPLYIRNWSGRGFLLGHLDNREDGKGADSETDGEHDHGARL